MYTVFLRKYKLKKIIRRHVYSIYTYTYTKVTHVYKELSIICITWKVVEPLNYENSSYSTERWAGQTVPVKRARMTGMWETRKQWESSVVCRMLYIGRAGPNWRWSGLAGATRSRGFLKIWRKISELSGALEKVYIYIHIYTYVYICNIYIYIYIHMYM